VLVDHNGLQGFGGTDEVASMSPLWDKLKGFDAELQVIDGHDMSALDAALREPQTGVRIIVLRTVKGHGVSFMANQMAWHYLPMNEGQYQQAMQDLEQA